MREDLVVKNTPPARLLKAIFLLVLLGTLLAASSCQRISSQIPKYLLKAVANVQQIHAPDERLELFNIQLHKKGDQVFVTGEVINPKLRMILMDSLRAAARYYDFIDSVKVLPEKRLLPKIFGIVYVSVAEMRLEPSYAAEMVNQARLGTVLNLYKEKHGYSYARNYDHYLGWISKAQTVEVDSVTAAQWQQSPHVICIANYGLVRKQMSPNSEIIVDLVPGCLLKKLEHSGNWVKVATPDERIGYVEKNLVMDETEFRKIQPSRERILAVAKSFLGVPYLWGGASPKAFDCSGFVQTVYFMNNVALPRDANQMVQVGEPLPLTADFNNVLPGDLLFFGSKPEQITHVAIYLGDQLFIHSDGLVHINSFDKSHPLYNKYRDSTLQAARRILTSSREVL